MTGYLTHSGTLILRMGFDFAGKADTDDRITLIYADTALVKTWTLLPEDLSQRDSRGVQVFTEAVRVKTCAIRTIRVRGTSENQLVEPAKIHS